LLNTQLQKNVLSNPEGQGMSLWCLTQLSTIFQLYRGCHCYW